MSDQEDLAAILAGARRGRSKDVETLVNRLPELSVRLPLAAPHAPGSRDVLVHLAPGPLGEKLGPLFTDDGILSNAGHRFGWTTAGAPLQLLEMRGRDALEMTLDFVRGGRVFGAALNPYDPTAIELRAAEIQGILAGDPGPLQRRLAHFPTRDDHAFFTGAVQEPSPQDLDRAIAVFLEAHPEISRHECAQATVKDRPKPVLHVTFWTRRHLSDEALAQELSAALRGKVPSKFGGLMVVTVPDDNRR